MGLSGDSLAGATARLVAFRQARGWERDHVPAQLAQSVVIEAAELLECFQWGEQPTGAHLADEMADVAIYLLNLAQVVGVDLVEAIGAKIDRNEQRFPVLA